MTQKAQFASFVSFVFYFIFILLNDYSFFNKTINFVEV